MPRRHAGSLGAGGSLFGDGAYSNNIYVGGVLVQPVAEHEYRLRGQSNPAQSTYYGTWASAGLWDDSTLAAGCWIGVWPGSEVWAQADLPGPMAVSKIVLRPRSDNYYARHPAAYRLEGWDGSAWVVLSTKTGITSAQFGWGVSYTDTINSAVQISKVRLVLTAMQAGNDGYFEIGELELYEKLTDCIVITGAATVVPDAVTGAAGFSCRNIALDGASASLTPTVKCKGLLGFVLGKAVLLNGAKMHMDKKGKAGNFGNLTAYILAPENIRRKLSRTKHGAYMVQGEGALGGAGASAPNFLVPGAVGVAAGAMQTGGGAGGGGGQDGVGFFGSGGDGGKGGPCCGGSGGGSGGINGVGTPAGDAGPYGGPGGDVGSSAGTHYGWGGSGDPSGASGPGCTSVFTGGGGLLMLFAGAGFHFGAGCVISADGTTNVQGGGLNGCAGGSSGGGCVALVTRPGLYTNLGTVRASGGGVVNGFYYSGTYPGCNSMGGGLGSVNIFTNAA